MKFTATLSKRFQITIPKAIRDSHRWKAGQKFVLSVQGDAVLMKPAPTLDELAGIAKGASSGGYRDRDDRSEAADAKGINLRPDPDDRRS
ncbi:MAG: AbrB/MazE/SpoVT family DNA-binding domain-containing protein [Zoogloeaceae bacterium]|nr:AbrB/MazE/SpoVT family DNA-binding domain-containing protein [Zoogloeaceae bacterium]